MKKSHPQDSPLWTRGLSVPGALETHVDGFDPWAIEAGVVQNGFQYALHADGEFSLLRRPYRIRLN